eukprot:5154961-Ditylum_brightwellii.AAC.1
MSYTNALEGMVIDIKHNNDSTYNSTPANHRKQSNVALGLAYFPKLPQKKKMSLLLSPLPTQPTQAQQRT